MNVTELVCICARAHTHTHTHRLALGSSDDCVPWLVALLCPGYGTPERLG